ncbi:S8 family peptidase [Hyalangium rubrum]|uniref:S8 family peptidase n=1 Tax=Hyalangium rubrum TaxID=3103134 RepID=A0ABU5H3M8_9BACT|nr:S8 family peptidase [Hyalangium sp. s54d21]MDY7227397.1 S8 family peptidase [Hyalangium sp. s54d21]
MRLSLPSKLALCGLSVSLLVACKTDPTNPTPGDPNTPCRTAAELTAAQASQEKFVTVERPIPGEFVVVLKEPQRGIAPVEAAQVARSLSAKYGGSVITTYEHALRGFAGAMSEEQARALSNDPEVAYVQQNQVVVAFDNQANAPWGLDRVDQRDLPLSKSYSYGGQGRGVNAYIIDTGIRTSHSDFGGRAEVGYDAINDGKKGIDCNGHGTHVAATVGGSTYGVAKSAKLYAVRVLSCSGSGSTAGVIAGVDWVTNNHVKPAVANMSLGGGADRAMDDAVRRSVAAGVTYVLAAGNDNKDACTTSPARTPEAITVGATTDTDARASFSNFGSCVDIFAPGHQITAAWYTSDTDTKTISGTSMAAPHTAGVAALYLERNPNASPNDVVKALADNATPGKVGTPGSCSPNKLAFTGFIAGAVPTSSAQ